MDGEKTSMVLKNKMQKSLNIVSSLYAKRDSIFLKFCLLKAQLWDPTFTLLKLLQQQHNYATYVL